MLSTKRVIQKALHIFGLEVRRSGKGFPLTLQRRQAESGKPSEVYSFLDEQTIVQKYYQRLRFPEYCVDIGASDGVTMSNTYALFRSGWNGLAIECDGQKFAFLSRQYADFSNARLAKCMVNPGNVNSILHAFGTPQQFGLLSLDIDGYDYFVLDQLLSQYRPCLICAEVNEKIPPPIKFTVNWDVNYSWKGDHFYGQSISQLFLLCKKYEYVLVELEYNNAFLVPSEINLFPSLSPVEAYQSGYKDRADRKTKFPWNNDMEEILSSTPEQALELINEYFSPYAGRYTISL